MNKANILVGLTMALAAVGVQGGWFSSSQSNKQVDFDGLEKWVSANLPADDDDDDEDIEASVEFIKSNLNQLKDDKVQRAAEVLLDIVGATQCSHELMQDFRQLAEDKVVLAGRPTLADIMDPALDRLNGLCGAYVDDLAATSREPLMATEEFQRFFEVVGMARQKCWKNPFGGYTSGLIWCTLEAPDWAAFLYKAASHDEQARNNYDASGNENRRAFDYAHEKYLDKPCKTLAKTLGNTFEAVSGLISLRCLGLELSSQCIREFVLARSNTTKPLLYAYQACKTLPPKGWTHNVRMAEFYADKFSPDRLRG